MALPSGTISMSQVNTELGRGATAALSMNDSALRTLAQVGGSGTAVSMNNLRGKSAYTAMNVTANDIYVEEAAPGNAYTGNWYPSVSVSLGSGGYTYVWTFTNNAGGFTLVTSTASNAQIRHSVTKFGYSGDAIMNCQVTDNTGHVVNRTVNVHVNIYDGQIA